MNNEFYGEFRNRLSSLARNNGIPLRALFELTYSCNLNCNYCYIPHKKRNAKHPRQLSTARVLSILDMLKNSGCFYLGFTGGEIFLRKDIWEILKYAKNSGFNITLCTNGSLLNTSAVDKLKKISPNKIDITLHSLNSKDFEKITGVKGSFNKVMHAIELLRKRNIPLGIKNCALGQNENEQLKVLKFAQKIGAQHRLGAEVVTSQLNFCQNLSFVATSSFKLFGRGIFTCGVGRESLVIDPQGRIKLCPHIDYPKVSVFKEGLKKAWDKTKDLVRRIESDNNSRCKNCLNIDRCLWCPAKSWVKFGNLVSCDFAVK
jgi:radical SAM protein with 4Fe4S-binding SPASM domain